MQCVELPQADQNDSSHAQSSAGTAKLLMIIASLCLGAAVAVFALPGRSPIFPTSSYASELV